MDSNYPPLKAKVSVETYEEKFHHLLCWEEQELAGQLAQRCNKVYQIAIYNPETELQKLEYDDKYVRYGHITSEDSDTLSYAKLNSQGSFIILDTGSYVHVQHMRNAIPYQEHGNAIVIAFTNEELNTLKKSKFYCNRDCNFKALVHFELNHDYFSILHRAIRQLPLYIVQKLNPTEQKLSSYQPKKCSYYVYPNDFGILDLDKDMQLKALKVILNSKGDLPIIVSGPFGTGKTRLLARAAYEILNWSTSRVLICAHHQASVDAFVEKYFGPMIEKGWEINMIRVITNRSYQSSARKKYNCFFKSAYDLSLHDFQKSRLIVTTLNTSQKLYRLIDSKKNNYFTYILIDEGAQTREPEAIVPLCLAGKSTTIVITGDHYQVGPRLLVSGDVPQVNGLGVSLLERLHALYDEAGSPIMNTCSATLLKNYRCHSGILMLPSNLYYHSTLLCDVRKDKAHHLASFPLTFVCSDISQETKATTGVNENEVSVLITEVVKYFKQWPENWSSTDKRICIISPSANQCFLIRSAVRKIKLSCDIEVLSTYNIQGAEFQAIFISTSEQTDDNGDPVNETKSTCDRFVFNTILTRSRSLVVAVGNPFSLLKKEVSMIQKHDASYKTWKPYIRQCIECKTLNYAECIEDFTEATNQLYKYVYDESSKVVSTSRLLDTIISDYKTVFEELPACKKAKVTLTGGNELTWSIQNRETNTADVNERYSVDQEFSDRYICQLKINRFRKAEAIPFDKSKKIVKISGLKNRKGAFDGETVEVGIFADGGFDSISDGKHTICYGRVIRAIRASKEDIKFVCQILHDDPLVFYPIDKKNPKLINLPRLSRDLLQKKDYSVINKGELKCTDVVVFNPNSIDKQGDDISLPQFENIIPLNEAKKMVFLVNFVKWEEKYPSPLGIVVGAYSKGHTPYNAERLLKMVHSVEYTTDKTSTTNMNATRDCSLKMYERVFTIDPDDSLNLDDALSITYKDTDRRSGCKVYHFGVHIVNAAKHIRPDTKIDESAYTNGITVYGGEKGKIMHMLDSSDTRLELSLIPGKLRDAISVTCDVFINDPIQLDSNSLQLSFGKCIIEPSQIKSCMQLTYKQAQSVMDGNTPKENVAAVNKFDEDHANPSLQTSIKLLYFIAKNLRQQRLQSDAVFAYDVDDDAEVGCWQAHLLVEEFMIWANSKVAEQIHQHNPGLALLRTQAAPNLESREAIINRDNRIMSCSLYLSQHLKAGEFEASCPQYNEDIEMPLETLKKVQHALGQNDINLLVHLLSTDRLYPQFVAVQAKFRKISLPSQYCCTQETETEPDTYRHDSLCLDKYTHFTSPIRRYIDIEVQRLLLGISGKHSNESQQKLCMALNAKQRNARDFERGMKNMRLAFQFKEKGSGVYAASICREEKGFIELAFAENSLKDLTSYQKSLKIANFIPFQKISTTDSYLWKLRITTLHHNLATNLLKSPNLSFKKVDTSSDKMENNVTALYCDDNSDGSYLSTQELSISQPNSTITISPNSWLKMHQFVKQPSNEKFEEVERTISSLSDSQLPSRSPDTFDIDTKKLYPFFDCEIKSTLKECDVFKVWLTWSTREPIISPAIQLIEVSPLLRICLQHNTHPAECFSDPNLLPASRQSYPSIKSYIDHWKAVLLAEASEKSIRGCQPTLIQGVHLEWPKLIIPKGCIEQKFYIPSGRVTMTIHRDFIENCYEFCKLSIGDLVCVRYGCDPHHYMRAVYHFVIEKCEEVMAEDSKLLSKIIVRMESIGESNCQVSEKMKEVLNHTCEIQIIPLVYSYRKVYRGLIELVKKPDSLAGRVAVNYSTIKYQNKYYKKCEEILKNDSLSTSTWTSPHKKLNGVQCTAMKKALEMQFQLIQGPPGTGKSITGAHLAYVLAKLNKAINIGDFHRCVLYCGPSNKSVDVVLEKFDELVNRRSDLGLRILRIYSKAIERKDYPSPKDYYNREHGTDNTCPDWAKPYAFHHLLRQKDYSKGLVDLEKQIMRMKQNKKMPSGKKCIDYDEVLKTATELFFENEKFDIVFCTCNEAAGARVKRCRPRQCIIDECGMAYEPEAIIPISLCEHAILIGDHKQLQPVIDYQPARDHGLTTSLFERCAAYDKDLVKLKIQYRMHEAICDFPSKQFYPEEFAFRSKQFHNEGKSKFEIDDVIGGLETDISVRNRKTRNLDGFWPRGNKVPIMFVDIVGEEGQEIGGNGKEMMKGKGGKNKAKVGVDSKYNMREATLVIKICKSLLQYDPNIAKEIAILTPYSAQKCKILEMVEAEELDIKVASVTQSQGDEYNYVILSTVRSLPLEEMHYVQPDRSWKNENLGFITDPHQINVGITRSKYGLIITGNRTLLEYDETWKNLLHHYEKKGCIVPSTYF